MSRGRRYPTWEDALATDPQEQETALYRYLVERGGRELRYWEGWAHHPANLVRALHAEAQAFVRAHRLHPDWAAPDSYPLRQAVDYVELKLIPHLAHWQHGRPRYTPFHEWTEAMRMKYHVGADTARATLIRRQAVRDMASQVGNARKKAFRAFNAHMARAYRKEGLSTREIGDSLGVNPRSVRRYLSEG